MKTQWVVCKSLVRFLVGDDSGNDDESPATGFRPLPHLFNL